MSEKQPKKKKTAGDVVLTVVLIAAICVFCYAGYNLFHIYTEYKKGTDEYNSITQMAVTERDPDGEAAGPEAGSELKAPMDIVFAMHNGIIDIRHCFHINPSHYIIIYTFKRCKVNIHRCFQLTAGFRSCRFSIRISF